MRTGLRLFNRAGSGAARRVIRRIHLGILRPEEMKNVVIACISGCEHALSPFGMKNLRDEIRAHLVPLGVREENVFQTSWNNFHPKDAYSLYPTHPYVTNLSDEIKGRAAYPSYLAIIGFDYGGWAACRVSCHLTRLPDFVGLIDPVFGYYNSQLTNNVLIANSRPRARIIKNWFQRNTIRNGDAHTGVGRVSCSEPSPGLSCGYGSVEGAANIEVLFLRDWDGNIISVDCGGQKKPVLASHTGVACDKSIHKQIVIEIAEGVHRCGLVNLAECGNVGQEELAPIASEEEQSVVQYQSTP